MLIEVQTHTRRHAQTHGHTPEMIIIPSKHGSFAQGRDEWVKGKVKWH